MKRRNKEFNFEDRLGIIFESPESNFSLTCIVIIAPQIPLSRSRDIRRKSDRLFAAHCAYPLTGYDCRKKIYEKLLEY